MHHSNPKDPGEGSVNAELPGCNPSIPTTSPQLNLSFSCKALISSHNMSSFSFLLSYQITGWSTFSQLWVSLNSKTVVALNPGAAQNGEINYLGITGFIQYHQCLITGPVITSFLLSQSIFFLIKAPKPHRSKLYLIIRGHEPSALISIGLSFNEIDLSQKIIHVLYFLMRIWIHTFLILKFYLERIIFIWIQTYVVQTISAHIQCLEATLSTNNSYWNFNPLSVGS